MKIRKSISIDVSCANCGSFMEIKELLTVSDDYRVIVYPCGCHVKPAIKPAKKHITVQELSSIKNEMIELDFTKVNGERRLIRAVMHGVFPGPCGNYLCITDIDAEEGKNYRKIRLSRINKIKFAQRDNPSWLRLHWGVLNK